MTEPRTVVTFSESTARDRIPIISIGMPVYNGARHIRAALDLLSVQCDNEILFPNNLIGEVEHE